MQNSRTVAVGEEADDFPFPSPDAENQMPQIQA